jgi:hypothetical protein
LEPADHLPLLQQADRFVQQVIAGDDIERRSGGDRAPDLRSAVGAAHRIGGLPPAAQAAAQPDPAGEEGLAGVTSRRWTIEDVIRLLDEAQNSKS